MFQSTSIGTTFVTGEKAPVSGVYDFVRHIDNSWCQATQEERRIPLSAGETFPPHRSCRKGVVWRLSQYA